MVCARKPTGIPGPSPVRSRKRKIEITGYAQQASGIWYYEILIEPNGPSSSYTVRRRYTEFRNLHSELSRIMAPQNRRRSSVASYMKPLAETLPRLPAMPPKAGLITCLMGPDASHLRERQRVLQEVLVTAESHPIARTSLAFVNFLGNPPAKLSGYVSLSEYACSNWESMFQSFNLEHVQRKRSREEARKSSRRCGRNSSSNESSLDSDDGDLFDEREIMGRMSEPALKSKISIEIRRDLKSLRPNQGNSIELHQLPLSPIRSLEKPKATLAA